MNKEVAVRNLQIITAFDSLSYGLICSFINTYLIQLGASHATIGIFTVLSFVAELISPDLTNILTRIHGRRYTLYFILNLAIVTNILLVLTCSYWFTIFVRLLHRLANRSQNVCYDLLLNEAEEESTREKLDRNFHILSGLGYILGPILSGYIFDSGFGYTGILAAFLSLINAVLLMNATADIQDNNFGSLDENSHQKVWKNVAKSIGDFKNCKPKRNWDVILMKYLFAGGLIVFFSKFTQILYHNYDASSVTMGYTTAYINAVVFGASCSVPITQPCINKFQLVSVFEVSMGLMAVLMVLACYAPYYALYAILLIPIVFLRTLLLLVWKDFFSRRKNDSLNDLNHTASMMAGFTIPLAFGLVCDKVSHHAVILFSCIPMFLCWGIIKWHSKFVVIDETDIKVKKDS